MQAMSRPRPLLIYGAVLSLLAVGVFFLPGIGPALLQTNGFAPHGVCILWQPGLLWFHVTNDLLIGSSYVAIATTLAFLVYRGRGELPFHWVFLAFGAFIISCGSTHFAEVWTFWRPMYWLSGYTKLITAIASVATAIALPALVPRILQLVRDARLSAERKAQLEAANLELAQLNARLRELDQLKSELFANVSHELRTPLTLILGPTERLLETAAGEQRAALETIDRSARLLQRHVDDLLDVARLDAGRFDLRLAPVDLGRLAHGAADLFAAAAHDKGLRLTVAAAPGLVAEADEDQLQRVFVNLLSNALKFTPAGGTVALSVVPEGPGAAIRVDDSGPGVPEALRQVVFERFRQADGGATRRHGGTGLGLAIARELVALHGGTIDVEASPLGGARFTVVLPAHRAAGEVQLAGPAAPLTLAAPPPPASPPEARPEPEAPIAAPGPERPLVLVVEDNPDLRQFLAAALAPDYAVASAPGGREGLEQAVAFRPQLIVSDLMMPEQSGEELLAAVRRHPELRETPFIVLTARADPDLRLRLLRAGAQDYLLKPFAMAELRARLANLLAAAQARETLRGALSSREADLAALSTEAAQLYAQAQDALRLRDEFLSIAAHELRTPVTALLGNAQLLARRWQREGSLPERDQRAVSALGDLARRLAGLIETMLDVTRLDREQLHVALAPLSLAALVADQVEQLRPSLVSHQIALELSDDPLTVLGDAERLAQVLGNLLSNAVKYSPEGGSIAVRAGAGDGHAFVSVTDQGIGIPADALPRLFERFYRAPNIDPRSISGFGIGLHLARELIARHGGELGVTSVEGQGSTFTLRLPLAPEGG
ncbi:MAG TPA: ATP-binding protein [Chloroflexaceae bacterium]|nr:ATP-binding protein [Chloroflexaceae bacterium]